MKKNTLTIFMALAIIVLLLNILQLSHNYSDYKEKVNNKFENYEITISELEGRIELLYKNDQFPIFKETMLIQENGDSIMLRDILFDKYIFVIRFSELNCNTCITTEMKHVADIVKSHNNIVCMATYSEHSNLINSKRLMNIPYDIYNIPFEVFKNDMEKKKLPYYFIIDKNYKTQSLFVADPNNFALTEKYLKYVSTLLNE